MENSEFKISINDGTGIVPGINKRNTREKIDRPSDPNDALAVLEEISNKPETTEKVTALSVADLAKKHGIVFVHGLNHGSTQGGSMLREQASDWYTKLQILLLLQPPLSSSTIKPGDTPKHFWCYKRGVILCDGEVEEASPYDAGTVTYNMKRTKRDDRSSPDAINRAITERPLDQYNEITIKSPQIAGFYIGLDKDDSPQGRNTDVPLAEIVIKTQELGLPLFGIKGGEIFEVKYDNYHQILIPTGTPLRPEEMTDKQYRLSPEKYLEVFRDIVKKSPFEVKKLDIPEVHYANAINIGRSLSYKLIQPNLLNGQETQYTKAPNEVSPWDLRDESTIIKYGEWNEFGEKVEYFSCGPDMYVRRYSQDNDRIETSHVFSLSNQGFIDFSISEVYLGENVGNSPDEFLNQVEKFIDKPDKSEISRAVAFSLYGFAEQIRNSQPGLSERALLIAQKVLPQSEYIQFTDKKLDSRGVFLFDPQDFHKLLD